MQTKTRRARFGGWHTARSHVPCSRFRVPAASHRQHGHSPSAPERQHSHPHLNIDGYERPQAHACKQRIEAADRWWLAADINEPNRADGVPMIHHPRGVEAQNEGQDDQVYRKDDKRCEGNKQEKGDGTNAGREQRVRPSPFDHQWRLKHCPAHARWGHR